MFKFSLIFSNFFSFHYQYLDQKSVYSVPEHIVYIKEYPFFCIEKLYSPDKGWSQEFFMPFYKKCFQNLSQAMDRLKDIENIQSIVVMKVLSLFEKSTHS